MKGWSLADVKRLEDAGRVRGVPALANPGAVTPEPPAPKRRAPNRWEAAYAREVLEPRRLAGEVVAYWYEALSLRIGRCRYTADYLVRTRDEWELHEVKGFFREAARVRLSAVLEMYPFPIVVARGGPGKWKAELWRKGA